MNPALAVRVTFLAATRSCSDKPGSRKYFTRGAFCRIAGPGRARKPWFSAKTLSLQDLQDVAVPFLRLLGLMATRGGTTFSNFFEKAHDADHDPEDF